MNGYVEEISEEQRLQNILKSCDEQLEKEPGNQWWADYRQQTQERLEEIYQTLYGDDDDYYDDLADYKACLSYQTSL